MVQPGNANRGIVLPGQRVEHAGNLYPQVDIFAGIVALEIPSGWMADVWGRRKTLILGTILGSAGFMMYSFSYGFWAFILAEIILGAGHSLFRVPILPCFMKA
jgi:MFS family permease